jgi:hypothetical protein
MDIRRQRGISRVGFATIVALAAALGFVLNETQATIEEARVNIIVRNMRTGLQVAIGEHLIRGEDNRLGELLAANPLEFLRKVPEGYVGETAVPDGAGTWRFDPTARRLEYRPRHPGAFDGRRELRWRLLAVGTVAGRPVGLRLEAM